MAGPDYYLQHRERLLANSKARYQDKKEEVRAYKKKYQQKNKARLAEKKRIHYWAHREEISVSQKEKYRVKSEIRKEAARQYRLANPEKSKAAVLRWCAANPARLLATKRAWAQRDRMAQPEKYAEIQSRRKAQKLQTQTERINFKKILRDANGMCGICHQPFDLFGIDFDHIVPLARGGAHVTSNIQATHARCNRQKGAKVG